MRRPAVMVVLASLAVVFAAAATATPPPRPSDRGCLVAWNAVANRANHVRLLAQRPVSGLQLLPARVATDRWVKGTTVTQTSSALACVLTIGKPGRVRLVTGIWRGGRVERWSFGRSIPAESPLFPNVRLLADGRVTKVYRH